ncbi:MAG: hypothetical protein OXG11_13355, partial [Chloroflexi bacterium]|nr:hypothetical protein [Chloroflexota bacterium]
LPNIWKPSFPLAYALAFVVLQRAARCERRRWPEVLTLAVLVGFIGLTSSSLAPIVLYLWAGLEAIRFVRSRRSGWERADLIRPATGLVLAALLMGVGGGVFTTALTGSSSGLSLGWSRSAESWNQMGSFDPRPGGVAVLGLGPLAVAGIAALMAWRDRLVLALIAGAFVLIIAVLVLRHDPAPYDLGRLAGHARNFALFALLLALSARLHDLRSRRRYAAGAVLAALVVWPTISAPISNVRLAMGRGIDLANAGIAAQTDGGWFAGRYKMRGVPEDIATYIQEHIAVDARVFSPRSHEMTYATGRPNASGFDGLVHILAKKGPAYLDVRGFLEPAAVRRRGFEYVHAPESWVENLPSGAAERLNDPSLFELLVRNESESLYRVLPEFLNLDAPPAPESYEALRQAVPASTTVFLSPISESELSAQAAHPQLSTGGVRAQRLVLTRTAHALSHARLLGTIDPSTLNLRTPWKAEPLGEGIPDLVIMPLGFAPWMFPAASREPIWWNDETAVYALGGSVEPIMRSPPVEPLQFMVRVSDASEADGRITFTAAFDDGGLDQWSGQDWVVVAIDDSPLGFPTQIVTGDSWTVNTIWFSGQILPDREASSLTYAVDLLAPSMAFRFGHDAWTPAGASEGGAPPGIYVLAMRLRHEFEPNQWRDAAIIPVLRITVSETGEVSYQVHKDAGGRAAD